MKNKKGFTLIELLAVIVVLAIIALIATPIVMNTIKKSQKGVAERSAENYIDAVETAIATAKLDSDGIPDGTYTIDENGNLLVPSLPNGKLTIEMSGNKPTGGTITISNGQVTTDSKMTVGSYEVSYNSTTNKYEAKESTSSEGDKTTSLICELQEGTSQTVGAKYTCHLDSDRTFYVLEISGENIVLLMDRNFTDDTVPKTLAWCIDGSGDNTSCKNINSKDEGTPLKHIQDIFGTNVEVGLPTANQIAVASGKSFSGKTVSELSTWLYDYLNDTANSVSDVFAYWTSTPHDDNYEWTWNVENKGRVYYDFVDDFGLSGVRPIITISKSQLN